MLIGFDASRAFVSEATGTENYSLNLLRALAKVDRKNQYRVYLRSQSGKSILRQAQVFDPEAQTRRDDPESIEGSKWKVKKNSLYTSDFDFELPKNFIFRPIGPSRFWTQLGLALETWRAPVDLLFVPAHTLPILRRRFLPMSSRGSKGPLAILRDCFSGFRRIAMTGRRMKYVVTIHDLGVEYLPGYHQFPQRYYLDFASRYAARHADGIIAVSAATKRDLIKRYHTRSKKIFVVHEGVDAAFFRPSSKFKVKSVKSKYKIKGPYILFVGTVQPRKNLRMLICAFADLVESGKSILRQAQVFDPEAQTRRDDPESIEGSKWKVGKNSLYTSDFDFELIIAGKLGWDYDEILKMPKKLGLEKRVKFLGRVADCDLPALYSGASVFAFPSLFEGFGLPILEALACGCPVVASDIAPHREIFEKISSYTPHFDFDSNLVPIVLAKPDDTGQWVNVLYQCISQYEKRSTYIASRNLALDLFSWEKVAVDTLQVFRKFLS